MKREKLDPYWHKARVAARILLKAQQGRSLNARDKRLAQFLANEKGVSNRLIQQGLYSLSNELRSEMRQQVREMYQAATR